MEIEQAILALALADTTLTGMIGQRMYPDQAPQAEPFPYVVFNQADQVREKTLTGFVNLNRYTLHLEVEGSSYGQVKAVYSRLRKPVQDGGPLVGFAGTVTVDEDTATIRGIFEVTGDESVQPPIHGGEDGVYRAGLDLSISYGLN